MNDEQAQDVPEVEQEEAPDQEDVEQEVEPAAPEAEEEPLEKAERERDEYLEMARRAKAEFENYRRRMSDELGQAEGRGRAELAGSLISVLDNLERALEAIEVEPAAALSGETEAGGPIEQGVILTYRELCGVLRQAGVEGYSPDGERFDPTWHEALQARENDGAESGEVLEVLQKGYRLGDRVLRPARVVVAA